MSSNVDCRKTTLGNRIGSVDRQMTARRERDVTSAVVIIVVTERRLSTKHDRANASIEEWRLDVNMTSRPPTSYLLLTIIERRRRVRVNVVR
jgi:hypothetical protein